MTVRFLTPNGVDTDATIAPTITSSSEAAGYPDTNVQIASLTRRWRTGVATAAEWIKFDYGAGNTLACTAAVIAGHDLISSDSSIIVESSPDDAAWTTRGTFTHDAGNMVVFFDTQSLRYWRVSFTKAVAASARNIGRIFLGTYIEPTRAQNFGWTRTEIDPSIISRARSGAVYVDVKTTYQQIDFTLNSEPAAGMSTLRDALKDIGIHRNLFLCVDPANPNGYETIYGYMAQPWTDVENIPNYNTLNVTFTEDV